MLLNIETALRSRTASYHPEGDGSSMCPRGLYLESSAAFNPKGSPLGAGDTRVKGWAGCRESLPNPFERSCGAQALKLIYVEGSIANRMHGFAIAASRQALGDG